MGKKIEETPAETNQKKPAEKPAESERLPALLEIIFDTSKLFILIIPLLVAVVSYVSGATWLDIVIRTSVTLLVTGILTLSITRRIVSASIEVTNGMLEKASLTETTIERQG